MNHIALGDVVSFKDETQISDKKYFIVVEDKADFIRFDGDKTFWHYSQFKLVMTSKQYSHILDIKEN